LSLGGSLIESAFLTFCARLDSEFRSANHFHIVKKRNHGVIVEVVLRDMFNNSLGHFVGSNDLDLCVRGFGVSRAYPSDPFSVDDEVGIARSPELVDFLYDPVPDGLIANDGHPLHAKCLHA
jgi:hypothetical protein